MARDRDHQLVAARARQDGEELLTEWAARRHRERQEAADLRAAWDDYVAKGKALAAIRPCDSVWPSSVADVAPTRCQLLHGHEGEHRHRILGTQQSVTW